MFAAIALSLVGSVGPSGRGGYTLVFLSQPHYGNLCSGVSPVNFCTTVGSAFAAFCWICRSNTRSAAGTFHGLVPAGAGCSGGPWWRLQPIPKLAIMPLILLVFRLGKVLKCLPLPSVFYLVLINTMAGVLNIDQSLSGCGQKLQCQPLELLSSVACPARAADDLPALSWAWAQLSFLIVAAS